MKGSPMNKLLKGVPVTSTDDAPIPDDRGSELPIAPKPPTAPELVVPIGCRVAAVADKASEATGSFSV